MRRPASIGLTSLALTVGIGLSAVTTPAHAQAQSHEAAVAAFEQARRAIDAGDCAGALPKLEESLRNEPSVGAHLSYADCFEAIDPYVAFWHLREGALTAFLRHDERHATTEKRAAALVPRIAAVRVNARVADLEAADFQLRLDDKPIDRFHLSGPIGVRVGEHTVSASTADGRRWSKKFTGEVGKVVSLEVALAAAVEPEVTTKPAEDPNRKPVDQPPAESRRGATQRTVGVIVAAVGASTIAAGAAFGVVTIARRNDLDRACNGDLNHCTGTARSINPILVSAENAATASTVLFTVGTAVLIGGIALWLTAPRGSSTKTTGHLVDGYAVPSGKRLAPLVDGVLRW
jgi:hypothetical protein